MVEIVLRIYKPNIIVAFDPLLSMIGLIIFSECWTNDNDVVKMLVIFYFNQLSDQVSFSTPHLANEYACVRFFDYSLSILFDAALFVN